MRPVLFCCLMALLVAGCGNRLDLPQETGDDAIPFKNYFVFAQWENIGQVSDIAITGAQALYIAEDSSTVKRFKRKGRNDDGTQVAAVLEELPGLERPVKMDEGAPDNLWVLDLSENYPASDARVVRVDVLDNVVTAAWRDDDEWPWLDTLLFAFVQRTTYQLREVTLSAIAADDDDNVFVGGEKHLFRRVVDITRDTLIAGDLPDTTVTTTFDTSYTDTTVTWFVRTYDEVGSFLYESVGTGAGVGFVEHLGDFAITQNSLVYIDGAKNQVKYNDPSGEHLGIDWITGEEATDEGEDVAFDFTPGGIAGDTGGYIYICDSGNNRIMKYDGDQGYVSRVDQNDPGIAEKPTAIAATEELVYVFDEIAKKIVLFEFPESEEEGL